MDQIPIKIQDFLFKAKYKSFNKTVNTIKYDDFLLK